MKENGMKIRTVTAAEWLREKRREGYSDGDVAEVLAEIGWLVDHIDHSVRVKDERLQEAIDAVHVAVEPWYEADRAALYEQEVGVEA